jgi:hypothetical protein
MNGSKNSPNVSYLPDSQFQNISVRTMQLIPLKQETAFACVWALWKLQHRLSFFNGTIRYKDHAMDRSYIFSKSKLAPKFNDVDVIM